MLAESYPYISEAQIIPDKSTAELSSYNSGQWETSLINGMIVQQQVRSQAETDVYELVAGLKIDATVSLSATAAILESGGTITYIATLDFAAKYDVTITLSNAAQITILAGESSGFVDVEITNRDDVYIESDSITASIISTSGGGFWTLTIDQTPAVTTVQDTVTQTTVSLSATEYVAESGGIITYTATLAHLPQSDVNVGLTNGLTITVPAGQSSGSADFTLAAEDDVYLDERQISVNINALSGGGFEQLSIGIGTAVTQVVDTVDTVTISLTGASAAVGDTVTIGIAIDAAPAAGDSTIVTLSNGAFAVFTDAYVPGTVYQSTSFTVDTTTVLSISSVVGGNYESVDKTETAQVSIYLYAYRGDTITLPDGTRQLVNSGTSGSNATLYSGHGLDFNGIDQYIELNGYVSRLIYFKNGVFTVDVIDAVLSGYLFGIANEGNGQVVNGVVNNLIVSPTEFDATTLEQIRLNPERALYWQDNVLKSDFLPQSTLDSMQTGSGSWYPLSENTSAGAYVRNHALPSPAEVQTDTWVDPRETVVVDGTRLTTTASTSQQLAKQLLNPVVVDNDFYVVEYQIVDITAGSLGFNVIGSGGLEETSPNSTTGFYRFVFHYGTYNDYGWGLYANDFEGVVDNFRVYPLANSGLTTVTNYTDTMRSNAIQLPYGYQQALAQEDDFGLQVGLQNITVEANSLADAQSQFLNDHGLTLTENAGQLEIE